MKIVKKNVYYCEHCNKRSLAGGHLKKHETHCTANPNRRCGVCRAEKNIFFFVEALKARFQLIPLSEIEQMEANATHRVKWNAEPVTLKEVRGLVDNCPACVLAVIRQCGFGRHYFKESFGEFDFKKEMEEHNSVRYSEPESYY